MDSCKLLPKNRMNTLKYSQSYFSHSKIGVQMKGKKLIQSINLEILCIRLLIIGHNLMFLRIRNLLLHLR